MRLFSRKIDRVSTEEERYRAAQAATEEAAEAAERRARYDAVGARLSARSQGIREARAAKRERIKTVGQIKKVGRGRYVTTGWEICVADGSGRVEEHEVTHTGTLAGFTPAELCRIAHGASCRRCR
ncbi:hypothetical protein [Streptomyces scopuliridis]|uniref:hypothetical protein n=1 Tax=Streptomyces scopuliridis TaxID=452529 RepID=UPI003424D801